MPKYDYPTAFSSWGPEEYAAIDRVITSDRFTMGEEVNVFEREFADFHGMKHGIMVNSGSSANLVAIAALFHLRAAPLKRGDTVAVPALAWPTTYAPLVQYGLEITLQDCDQTWNANTFVGNHTRLIIGCSILGNPAYLSSLRRKAETISAYFIEDNCESLGGLSRGQRTGTHGLMNTFSFFYSHQISAIEGGMILTDDDECAYLCRLIRNHGNAGWESPNFESSYDFVLFGLNVRPIEMHAAIAREQLRKLPEFCAEREANRLRFRDLTRGLPILMPEPNGVISSFGLVFTVKDRETRSSLVMALRAIGIDCRLPTGGSFRLHEYGRQWRNQQTPEADRIHTTGMFLGNPPFDISDKIERAVKVMREVLT